MFCLCKNSIDDGGSTTTPSSCWRLDGGRSMSAALSHASASLLSSGKLKMRILLFRASRSAFGMNGYHSSRGMLLVRITVFGVH